MTGSRFAVLGLARSRSDWLRAVARWSTSGALPAELVMCVSTAELVGRLVEGRPVSALLVDGTLPGVDRDLLDLAARSSTAVVVVSDAVGGPDWLALGASAVLPASFERQDLLDALVQHATPVSRRGREVIEPASFDAPTGPRGVVAAVCGTGGTGASTVAAALAQGLGSSGRWGEVLLADLALHADQAMLHDVREVGPGVQELVEAHRSGTPSPESTRAVTFELPDRGYGLLLGLRRARQWSTVRPRAFERAFESLCGAFGAVVCDVDPDLEDTTRLGDQADRCLFARTAVSRADVVLAVGRGTAKGLHGLARVVADLVESGVPGTRVVPVVVGAPRSPGSRAGVARTVADLAGAVLLGPALFLPSRRVDEAIRDGSPVPPPLPALVAGAFEAVVTRAGLRGGFPTRLPELVVPGSLGLASG